MKQFIVSHFSRIAAVLTLCALCALTLAASENEKTASPIDLNAYAGLMSNRITRVEDLISLHYEQEDTFALLIPPGLELLNQPGNPDTLVIDFSSKELNPNLVQALLNIPPVYRNSVPTYEIALQETVQGTIEIRDNADQLLYTDPAPIGYVIPYELLFRQKQSPMLYYPELARYRLKTKLTLLPEQYVEHYLYAQARIAEAAALLQEEEGGGMMLMREGMEKEVYISGMREETNGLLLELSYPESYSGTVWSAYSYDALVCEEDCGEAVSNSFRGLESVWTLISSNIVLTGETSVAWIDTRPMGFDEQTNPVHRFYAFGANTDSDNDGLNGGYELFVTKTNPDDPDSDEDGLNDGWEVQHGFDPDDPADAMMDADGDGFLNLEEYQAGSNPTNPLSAPALAFYVDAAIGADANTGTFNSRFASIGKALQTALSNDYVFVFPGIYTGSMNRALSYQGKKLRVRSLAGPESTMVDAGSVTSVFRFVSGETRDAELKGFTIQGGFAYQGGGIYCLTSSPRIVECIIQSNSALFGGGIFAEGQVNRPSRPMFTNCVIRYNYAATNGGGVYLSGASPDVRNSRIDNNEAHVYGGGLFSVENTYSVVSSNFTVSIYSIGSSPTVTASSVSYNLSKGYGSAVVLSGPPAASFTQYVESRPRIYSTRIMGNRNNNPVVIQQEYVNCLIENSTIANNVSTTLYAGVYVVQSAVVLNHTTINDNQARYTSAPLGAGLFSHNSISTRRTIITNSVIWGNWPTGDQVYANVANSCRLYYSCFDPSASGYIDNKIMVGTGVITNNPLITRMGTLASNSPARNVANFANPPAEDIHGESRPQGGGVDMGSDEYFDSNNDGFPDWWMREIGLDPSATLDPAANHNTNELTNAQEYIAGTNPFAPVVDSDNDGLSDAAEAYHRTDPHNWDTSGNLFPDGWLVQYGFDPRDPNGINPNADQDGDGLSNFNELRHGTNPLATDSDGDGVGDGIEVSQGSDSADPDDNGNPTNCVAVSLVIGDHSGSHSERYEMIVGNKRHQAPQFGELSSNNYAFVKGKSYPFRVNWIDTNGEGEGYPDYDYTAKIAGMGGGAGWHASTNILVHDPQGVLGEHDESTYNFAAGKTGTLYVLRVGLGSPSAYSGNFVVHPGDMSNPNTIQITLHNPAEFEVGKTDVDSPCDNTKTAAQLVVFRDSVSDSNGDIEPFDIFLNVYPTNLQNVYWYTVQGPASGIFYDEDKASAKFSNPALGGVYQWDAVVNSSVATRVSLNLPLAGADMTGWLDTEAKAVGAWAVAHRTATETANYSPYPFITDANVIRTWIDISRWFFDYVFRPVDISQNSPCKRFDPTGAYYRYATVNGVVVHGSKLNNMMWALFGRSWGYSVYSLQAGAHLNQLARELRVDGEASQNAVQLGSQLHDLFSASPSASITTILTPQNLRSIQDPDVLNEEKLWPSMQSADSGSSTFTRPTLPTTPQ